MEEKQEYTVPKRSVGKIIFNIIKFVGFMALALLPMQMVVILIEMQDELSTGINSILGIICFLLIITVILFLWNRYFTYAKEEVQKIGWRDLRFALLFFLIARVIAIVGTLLLTWLYGEEMTANDEALNSITDDASAFALYFMLFVLAMGILVPIAEELTYRGIGTHLLFKKHAFWLPLIITSIIFGLMHTPTNIIAFFLYGLIGVVCYLAYYRRKNILDSMLVHILNNGVSAVFLFVSYIMGLM